MTQAVVIQMLLFFHQPILVSYIMFIELEFQPVFSPVVFKTLINSTKTNEQKPRVGKSHLGAHLKSVWLKRQLCGSWQF